MRWRVRPDSTGFESVPDIRDRARHEIDDPNVVLAVPVDDRGCVRTPRGLPLDVDGITEGEHGLGLGRTRTTGEEDQQ